MPDSTFPFSGCTMLAQWKCEVDILSEHDPGRCKHLHVESEIKGVICHETKLREQLYISVNTERTIKQDKNEETDTEDK